MSRRVERDDAPASPFRSRRPRGPRRYTYGLADILALTRDSEAALWKAMQRADIKPDDFRRLVPWLAERMARRKP